MRFGCLFVSCCALAFASPARALDLQWNAPAGCPNAAALEAEIAERLQRPREELASVALRVRGEIVTSSGRPSLSLAIEAEGGGGGGGGGERRLLAEDCETLTRAAAIIVALAIDPARVDANALAALGAVPEATAPTEADSGARVDAPTGAGANATANAAADPGAAAEPDRAEREDASPSEPIDARLLLRADAVGDLGSLDAPALGPAAGLGLVLDRSRVEVTLAYLPPADTEITGKSEPVAELRLLTAGLAGCYALADGSLTVGPCLGAEVGNMWGRGRNLALHQNGNALWLAALAGVRATWWAADSLGLTVAIDAGLPLLRTLFTVEGLGTVHETSGPVARARLGVEARL